VGLFLKRLTLVVGSTGLWQFLISGFGEGILYRGYIQSRINEESGRPFTFMGVNFGAGVIISSILFGLAHGLNPFNPLVGEYDLAWWWGLSSGVAGFTFGMVREKTQSIIASGIGHDFLMH
jgi:membrane protease YdiL (CAAX protease family)